MLVGCAGSERVVLLPAADGSTGRVVIEGKTGATELAAAWAEASMGGSRVTQPVRDADDVRRQFAGELAALPAEAMRYTLYFEGDSDALTPASSAQAAEALAAIARLPFAEVVAIGHTDRMGEMAYNDELSLARAQVVGDTLTRLGVDAARMSIAGRGERELLVDTPDETPEPRNRRVEINVR